MPTRASTTTWSGDLKTGGGTVVLDSSGAGEFGVTFPARAGEPEGLTSPEELIAAAHSACYSMSLSNGLSTAGTPPESLVVTAAVTLGRDEGGLLITDVALTVRAVVPGATAESFAAAAETAKAGCPVSRALAAVPSITLDAALA